MLLRGIYALLRGADQILARGFCGATAVQRADGYPHLLVSLEALVVMGAGDMVSFYIRHLLVQLETPDAIRGRVSAVNSVFIADGFLCYACQPGSASTGSEQWIPLSGRYVVIEIRIMGHG